MVKKQQLNSSRGKGNENDGFRGFSATVPRFNLRKKRGKKTMEKLMKLMKLFLSLGGFWMKHNNWLKWLEHLDLQH